MPGIPLIMNNQLHLCIREGTCIPATIQSQLSRKHPGFAWMLDAHGFTVAREDFEAISLTLFFTVNTSFSLTWGVQFPCLDWADHYRLSSAKLLSMFSVKLVSMLWCLWVHHCLTCHARGRGFCRRAAGRPNGGGGRKKASFGKMSAWMSSSRGVYVCLWKLALHW